MQIIGHANTLSNGALCLALTEALVSVRRDLTIAHPTTNIINEIVREVNRGYRICRKLLFGICPLPDAHYVNLGSELLQGYDE